MISSVYY